MAAFISNIHIPLFKTHQKASFKSTHPKFPAAPTLSLTQKSLSTRKPANISKAFSEIYSSSSSYRTSTIKNLKRENEEQDHGRHPETLKVADVWRQIHGENHWIGLLEPMDPVLRSELIRYGEMAQACYDAFDYHPYSKYCGSCRFTRSKLFESLGMTRFGYSVTRYLYATVNSNLHKFFRNSRWPSQLWSKHAKWAGYVAVSDNATTKRLGRRDIAISWRGTGIQVMDLMTSLIPISSNNMIPCPDEKVEVESAFLELYTYKEDGCGYSKCSAREQVLTEVKRLLEKYSNEKPSITITGHSLGSALAILNAFDIVETGLNILNKGSRCAPVSVFSFSGPKVGNVGFKERLECLGVNVLRVLNVHDIVPKLPTGSYSHVGVKLELDHKNSPFLKTNAADMVVCAHDLEALLHLLDGYHGSDRRFVLATGRHPSLVNKACDFLKHHYMVPPYWKQDENKGLIKTKDGRWVQPERPRPDTYREDVRRHHRQIG